MHKQEKALRATWRALRRRLPLDGQGLEAPRDAAFALLRRQAAQGFWRRVPSWSRPLLILLARLLWLIAAAVWAGRFARRFALTGGETAQLLGDCLAGGAQPFEAFVWRRFFSPSGRHPLPGRSAVLLLSQLGDPAARRLLADKLATAEWLAAAGLPTPPMPAILEAGQFPDASRPPWSRPTALVAKPRHGAAGQGTLVVEPLAGGMFRIEGGATVALSGLRLRLAAAGRRDDLLVQERLDPAPALDDLTTAGLAPVLRLTLACEPGGPPALYAAILEIGVPGEDRRHFIRGRIRVPVDCRSGRMTDGFWFLHPERRFARLPWNDAPLAGRALPDFAAAIALALRAGRLTPGLPLVNWDIVLTAAGPILLEGNACGDWILTSLPIAAGLPLPPLAPLLQRWADASSP